MSNKLLGLVLMLLIVAAGWYFYLEQKKQQYELEEHCGKQARAVFEKETIDTTPNYLTSYSSHYNASMNKCFYLKTERLLGRDFDSNKPFLKWMTLLDLNENRELGIFFNNRAQKEVFKCKVVGKECSSEIEWEGLIKPYMQDSNE